MGPSLVSDSGQLLHFTDSLSDLTRSHRSRRSHRACVAFDVLDSLSVMSAVSTIIPHEYFMSGEWSGHTGVHTGLGSLICGCQCVSHSTTHIVGTDCSCHSDDLVVYSEKWLHKKAVSRDESSSCGNSSC